MFWMHSQVIKHHNILHVIMHRSRYQYFTEHLNKNLINQNITKEMCYDNISLIELINYLFLLKTMSHISFRCSLSNKQQRHLYAVFCLIILFARSLTEGAKPDYLHDLAQLLPINIHKLSLMKGEVAFGDRDAEFASISSFLFRASQFFGIIRQTGVIL